MVAKSYTEFESSFEEWYEKIQIHREEGLTETDTRSKLIDSLFIEVLGWDEAQIVREAYVNKIGFYDYQFNSGKNNFILEAKKTEIDFTMPRNRTIKYKALKEKNSKLKETIKQGIDYAALKSIDVVVVFNGNQLAITYIPYSRLSNYHDTYLFYDLEDMRENLIRFYNLLSPLINGKEEVPKLIVSDNQNALIRNKPNYSERINVQQVDFDVKNKQNELAKYFEYIHGTYFSDITSDEELLKKCYCESEIAGKLERELEIVLRDRAPLNDFPIEEIQTSKRSAGKFQEQFNENVRNTKLFLLLGSSGVGKTTFIFRFFKNILTEHEKEHLIWLYLDFKEFSEEGKSIDEFVYQHIEEQLLEKYEHLELYTNPDKIKSIFAKDLKKASGRIAFLPTEEEKQRERAKVIQECSENSSLHIKRIFEYIRSMHFGTCIIYDNVDQLNTELQKRLFKHANTLRESLKTTVICSLREEVYYNHRNENVFNFSEVEIFHIPHPRLLNVLSKRIKILREGISEDDTFDIQSDAGKYVNVKKMDIIDVLNQTFLGKQSNNLMIEMLANHDLRNSLKYFRQIITSYSIDFDEVLISAGMHAVNKVTNKVIDSSQILRALALQDRTHFNGNKSEPLINIFSIEQDGFFSHFTKIRILLYAKFRLNTSQGQLPLGYFKVDDMYNEKFKNTVNSIDNFLEMAKKLQKVGALRNSNGSLNTLEKGDYVILGPAGHYYLSHLMYNPFYLSLMAIDTPIADNEKSERIAKIYAKSLKEEGSMQQRRFIAMSNLFVEYLIQEEEKEIQYVEANTEDIDSVYFSVSKDIKENYDNYIDELEKNWKK